MNDPGFRTAVNESSLACRTLSDRDLRAFATACLAELARREGVNVAATWAAEQATRLAALDGATA